MAFTFRPQQIDSGGIFDAYVRGRQQGEHEFDRQTLVELGQRAAQGDFEGAQRVAFERGAPEQGFRVQAYRDSRQDRATANAERARKIQHDNVTRIAGFVQDYVLSEPDPALRAEKYNKFLSVHPDAASLPAQYRDPNVGPQLIISEARGYREPAEPKYMEVNGRIVAVGGGGAREVYASPQGATGGFKDLKQQADVEAGIRKEATSAAGPFIQVRDSYSRILRSAEQPSAAGDLALIFNYMKMLDPGSTVREGEFATAQNATGVPQQVINIYNRLRSGERLAPQQRDDFVGQAGRLYQSQSANYQRTRDQFGNIAKGIGLDPARVTLDFALPEPPTATLPAPSSPQQGSGGVTRPASEAEYNALPSGSRYIDPTGQERIKQ